ncbi:hypothetical protein Taro_021172, partial [Colocasia esculenta]|nr:hypothetical protein [Colocasia esculenta]
MADAILIVSDKGDAIRFRAVKCIFPWPNSAVALLSWGRSCCGCEGFAGHSWSNWSSFGEVSECGQAWEHGESRGGVRIVLLALVRASRKLHVPLVARTSLIVESNRHHQQSKVLSCGALGVCPRLCLCFVYYIRNLECTFLMDMYKQCNLCVLNVVLLYFHRYMCL